MSDSPLLKHDSKLTILQMGGGQGGPRFGGGEWEDDEEEDGQPQCATQ
jgi:hypothetical protein